MRGTLRARMGFLLGFLACLSGALAQGDFQKGVSYYKQGQYEKAILEFEELVKAYPDYEDGYRILGDCYLKTKQWAKAAQAFQKALELKGDLYVSYFGLALAHYNQGNFRDAIATLLKAERYARSPRDQYQLYHTRGSAYFNAGDYAKAVSDLSQAASIQRGNLDDLLQLGLSHYHLGNVSQAESYLGQVLSIDSGHQKAREFLGRLRYQAGVNALQERRYRQAARLLKESLAYYPSPGEAWFNLGLAYLFSEDLKEAETAFLEAAKSLPNNGEIYDRLGYICEKTGRYQKSLEYYQRAYQLSPTQRLKESVERVQERIRRQKTEG